MAAGRQTTSPAPAAGEALLLGERFRILPGTPRGSLGGHPCFTAQDRRGLAGDLVALHTEAGAPARARLPAFAQFHHEAMMSPLAHGVAGSAYWMITDAPPGPSLASLSAPWSGNGLLTHVLRPVALALDQMQATGLTHRAIRPDNLFVAASGKSVVLGPCWAAPAALHQPVVFEPPESALCAPAARGDGGIADDVYALGVVLLALWTGAVPLDGMEAREIIRHKLEYGSHAALIGSSRLQRGFEEILRAMLSDDPLARPTPASLANLDGIHARRGGQRSILRAARPIAVGEQLAWNRRMLALCCAEQPAEAMQLLRQGAIEQWLRRSAEDGALAAVIEEVRQEELLGEARTGSARPPASSVRINDNSLMRLVAVLDPLAPLFWRGCWMWPDALGAILAGSLQPPSLLPPAEAQALLEFLLVRGGALRWRQLRPGRPEQTGPMPALRLLRPQDPDAARTALLQIAYVLNPYLPCASPKLSGAPIMDPAALIATLERLGGTPLLDPHILAFLDARLEDPSGDAVAASGTHAEAMRELSVLARCQTLIQPGPLPRIGASLGPRLEPLLQDWPGVTRRQRQLDQLRDGAGRGDLAAMFLLVGNSASRQQDEGAREQASVEVDAIRAALAEQERSTSQRVEATRRAARETASAAGILCVMAMLLLSVLA